MRTKRRNFRHETRELLMKMTRTLGLNPELALRVLRRMERGNYDVGRAPNRIVASICWTIVRAEVHRRERRMRMRDKLTEALGVPLPTMSINRRIILRRCSDIVERNN